MTKATKIPRAPSLGEETFALQLKACEKLPPGWRREYEFHQERDWAFDFALPEYGIAVEIEGGTNYGKSRHSRGKGFEGDCEKYNAAAALGWAVYRFSTAMVIDLRAIEFLEEIFTWWTTIDRMSSPYWWWTDPRRLDASRPRVEILLQPVEGEGDGR